MTMQAGILEMGNTRLRWKARLRWDGIRRCENCIHTRELTEAETEKYKKWEYRPGTALYCTYSDARGKYYPHPTPIHSQCFCHEYDDESVLLPMDPKWTEKGVNDLYPYERERRDLLLLEKNQISVEEFIAHGDWPKVGMKA